jgi:hypothetical protein
MTKHFPHHQQRQAAEQPKPKEIGWYCFEHGIKWLCKTCGANVNRHDETDKYYFVNG